MKKNVIEYLIDTAKKYPDKIAVIEDNLQITFSELNNNARKVAASIRKRLGNNSVNLPIVVSMNKSIDMVTAFLGILYSGNFYCPIDVKMPKDRVKQIVSVLNPVLTITNNIDENNVDSIYIQDAYANEMVDDSCLLYKKVLDIDPIYTLFTSGSTGVPKGVVISHRGVIDYIDWIHEKFGLDSNTVLGNQAPFYFDNSIFDIYSMLKNGATMVIIPESMFLLPNKLLDYIGTHNINTIFWVPSALAAAADSGILLKHKVDSLEKILFCGEVMPCKQLNIWREAYPKALYVNMYGPTEITDVCTYYIVDREFKSDDSLPIGKACENTDVLILNEENKPCNINENGELCVRGCGVSLGYYSNCEKTNSSFVQNPLNTKYRDIIYRTGDIVYINDKNEIIYVGRKDFQIKYQGHRIELGEIESALGDLVGIKQGCAVYDDKEKKIILFCKADDNIIDEKNIYNHLRNKIPKYMLPKEIHIIDEFPLNLNGKIDRLKLKSMNSRKED